jgi:uncharacterized membrane protein
MPLSAVKIQNGFHWIILAALGVTALAEILAPNFSDNLDALLLFLAGLASLTTLARQLPLQNVLLAAAITALIGGVAHGLSARLGIPFGPLFFNENAGTKIFEAVPWTLPLWWIVALFNSRGVVRLALRPWRKTTNYGWWLIGLTAALAVGFDLALEPFAHVKHLWLWQPTKLHVTWFGASPLNSLGWAFIALFILAFTTPSLIKKQPGGPSKPDYMPLVLWLMVIAVFAVNGALAGLWLAVIVDVILAGAATFFAIRGARW